MSKHRVQQLTPAQREHEEAKVEVADHAAELRALWVLFPAAAARDSRGLLNDEPRSSSAGQGSPSPVNNAVLEATVLIETEARQLADAVTKSLLPITPATATLGILNQLEQVWALAEQDGIRLAQMLRRRLRAWVSAARAAIGTRDRDRMSDHLCPDHRAERPTNLRVLGSVAEINPALLAGPPDEWHATIGPRCSRYAMASDCTHKSCHDIAQRRHVEDDGRRSDWVLPDHREQLRWSPDPLQWPIPKRGPASETNLTFTWRSSGTVRCPWCKRTWTSKVERRLLARELAVLGDHVRLDTAELLVAQ